MRVAMKSHALPVYKKNRIAPLLCIFETIIYIVQCYNSFRVYCRELAPGTVSLTGDRAQGDDSKHDSHYTHKILTCVLYVRRYCSVVVMSTALDAGVPGSNLFRGCCFFSSYFY